MLELGDCPGPGRAPALAPVAEGRFASTRLDHQPGVRGGDSWPPDTRVQRTRPPRLASALAIDARPFGPRPGGGWE